MLALIIAQAVVGAPPPAVTPTPDFPAFQAIAEAGVKDRLNDPDSARFKWDLRTFHMADPRMAGITFACGMLNARNRFGGYDGYRWIWVGEKDGAVVHFDIDSDANDIPGRISDETACRNWGYSHAIPISPAPAPPAG